MIGVKERSNPLKDEVAYGTWALQNRFCWACGIPYYKAGQVNRQLSTHHIIKSGRSDEFCNLMRLCRRCHDSAEGQEFPNWTQLELGIALSIKKAMDPHAWNPERMAELYHKELPDLIPIPAEYDREFIRWNHSGRVLLQRPRRTCFSAARLADDQ